MLLKYVAAVAALLASSATASPHDYGRQDACAKAVASGPNKPPRGSAAASSDCASFLSKTVSPCPVTSTKTQKCTRTAKAITSTSTKLTTETSTALSTLFNTVDKSLFSTVQQTQLTTLILPETTTALTTVTTTTTSTVLETSRITTVISTAIVTSVAVVTSTLPQQKRAPLGRIPDRVHVQTSSNDTILARNWGNNKYQCHPSVSCADDVPKYASPCRSPQAYSSACQQLGVSPKTTTLPPSTIYATTSSTDVVTPTIIVTTTKTLQAAATKIVTVPVTQLRTSINTLTSTLTLTTTTTSTVISTISLTASEITTAVSTAFDSVIATTTEVVTSTLLVTPSPIAACSGSFRLQVSGSSAGIYVRSNGNAEKMGFTNDLSSAAILALDAQNRVYEPSSGLYPNTDNASLYYVYLETQARIASSGYLYLTCSTDRGRFKCTTTNGSNSFFHCPVVGPPDALIFGTTSAASRNADCVLLTITPLCL